jgi:hypothetical protein
MSMRSLLVLIGLAGCGFEPGSIVSGDAAIQHDGDVDTPSSPGDSDGDSVTDDVDNCPTIANANQRNHDGDPRGDVCDLCPGLFSPTDPDGDSDGVGDDCDPRPGLGGDSFVLFEGFYDAASISSWTSSGGTWTVSQGRLVQSAGNRDYDFMRPSLSSPLARHSVMTSARLDDIGQPNGDYVPAVAVGGGIAAGRGYFCALRDSGSNVLTVLGYWFELDQAQSAQDDDPWPGTFAVGTEVTLFGRIVGNNSICTASQAGTSPLTVDENHGPTTGVVEVSTSRMAASFDYVFVVSVGE